MMLMSIRYWLHLMLLRHTMTLRRHDGSYDVWWDIPCRREFRVLTRPIDDAEPL